MMSPKSSLVQATLENSNAHFQLLTLTHTLYVSESHLLISCFAKSFPFPEYILSPFVASLISSLHIEDTEWDDASVSTRWASTLASQHCTRQRKWQCDWLSLTYRLDHLSLAGEVTMSYKSMFWTTFSRVPSSRQQKKDYLLKPQLLPLLSCVQCCHCTI